MGLITEINCPVSEQREMFRLTNKPRLSCPRPALDKFLAAPVTTIVTLWDMGQAGDSRLKKSKGFDTSVVLNPLIRFPSSAFLVPQTLLPLSSSSSSRLMNKRRTLQRSEVELKDFNFVRSSISSTTSRFAQLIFFRIYLSLQEACRIIIAVNLPFLCS